jgi:hypothetical protein
VRGNALALVNNRQAGILDVLKLYESIAVICELIVRISGEAPAFILGKCDVKRLRWRDSVKFAAKARRLEIRSLPAAKPST